MIQRIQTVWLFLAAFIFSALFIFPVYQFTVSEAPSQEVVKYLGSKNYYALLATNVFMVLFPLAAIFFYSNRSKQKNLIWLGLLSVSTYIVLMLMDISEIKSNTSGLVSDSYSLPGALIPVIGTVFLILALRAIRKDDKLVRSMDRLR